MPFPGAVIDFINLMSGLPLANLANLLHVNNNVMELHEAMVVEEYITVDDDLPVALPLGTATGKILGYSGSRKVKVTRPKVLGTAKPKKSK